MHRKPSEFASLSTSADSLKLLGIKKRGGPFLTVRPAGVVSTFFSCYLSGHQKASIAEELLSM